MRARTSKLIAVVVAAVAWTGMKATAEEAAPWRDREPMVHAIVVDPSTASTIYLGTDEGLAFSDDGGKTWTRRPFDPPESVQSLALDPRDRSALWAGTGRHLHHTRDRGLTWTTMRLPPYHMPLWLRIFAKAFQFYSEDLDEGAAATARGEYQISSIVVVPEPQPVVLVGAIGVLRSTDDGASWRRVSVTGEEHLSFDERTLGIDELVADPHDARRVWAVGDHGILVTEDAGATWTRETSGHVESLAVDPNATDTLYWGASGISRSDDGGRTWTPIGGDLAEAFVRSVAIGVPGTLYATVQGCGLFTSFDGGRSWARSVRGESSEPLAIISDPHDAATTYAGMFRGLQKTTDGGAHWSRQRLRPIPDGAPDLVITAFAAAPPPDAWAPRRQLSLSVTNAGNGAVPATPISHTVYLSSDDTLSADDMPLESAFWRDGAAPGGTYSMQIGVTLPPVPVGHYFLIAQVEDRGFDDADERNNVRAIAITTPDPAEPFRQLEKLREQGMDEDEYKRERELRTQLLRPRLDPCDRFSGARHRMINVGAEPDR